jgi:hypothetical protein
MRHSRGTHHKMRKGSGLFVDFQYMNTMGDIYLTQKGLDDLVTRVNKPIALPVAAKSKSKPVGRVVSRKRKYKQAIDTPITPGTETGVI